MAPRAATALRGASGQTAIEYAGLLAVLAVVVAAMAALGIPRQIEKAITAAVCSLEGEKDCSTGSKTGARTELTKRQDPDRDGLSTLQERRLGTSPRDDDSDGDGVLDGAEFNGKLDPRSRDTDEDGIEDARELALQDSKRVNPREADSDGDGLLGGAELAAGTAAPWSTASRCPAAAPAASPASRTIRRSTRTATTTPSRPASRRAVAPGGHPGARHDPARPAGRHLPVSAAIYEWVADSDRFATLETLDESDLDLFIDGFDARPMAAGWPAPAVRLRRDGAPPGDFPSLFGGVPVLGRRAVEALGAQLEPHGELLPLDAGYWAFNVITLADVLDEERSEADWLAPGRMSSLRRLVTRGDLRGPLPAIFKLPQWRKGRPLITADLAELITHHGLTGLDPRQVGAA